MRFRVLFLLLLALVAACAPKTMKQRMKDSEKLADRATSALDDAEKAANDYEPDAMDKALAAARTALMDPDINLYPEMDMLSDRLVELNKRAPEVRAEREKRDLEKKLNAAREKIVPKMQAMRDALDALLPDAPTSAQVEAVEKAAGHVREDLDAVKDLLARSPDFASWAKGQRVKTERALEAAKGAKKKAKFLEGPVVARTEGAKAWKAAKKTKDNEERTRLCEEARDKYKACIKEGEKLAKDEELATALLAINGKPTAPINVVSGCKDDLEDVKTELGRLKELEAKKPDEPKKKKKKK